MSGVNEKEIKTQERILHEIFEKKLGYTYLGNYEDRENNSNIEEDLLLNFLTKKYSEEISKKAIAELKKIAHNESKSLYEVNKEFYEVLKYGKGISLYVGEKDEKVYFIDYNDFSNNDFYVAEEVTVKGQNEKRPDIVVYINGIAIAVIELKRSTVSINEGIRQNLDNQDPRFIERFFTTVQLLVAGNDTEGLRYATTKTPAKYYLPWIEDIHAIGKLHEKVKGLIDTNDFLIDQQIPSLFEKERLIDLIDNFILFDSGIKKVPRYNQYFGVTNAREFIQRNEGGIIWHTQGSGKSLSMVLLAKWILSNVDDSRVLIFTDRKELDKQIKDVFVNTGETKIHRATSCSNLLESLNDYSSGNLICSLIHKVGASVDEDSDKDYADYIKQLNAYKNSEFKAKGNIFVFVDECHRSQAGILHDEMKRLLPDATFIGFTGTPLMKKNKVTTLEKFGKYIHTYKFDQAVKDGIVVDLCYESRNVEQRINNPAKIDEWFESKTEGLNEFAKQKLKERWGTLQNITSSESRLEEIVKDIIFDFEKISRLAQGKGTAMLVASSIYEACRYWEIFQAKGFTKCAIVSSYSPYIADIKGESTGEFTLSDKQKIYDVYEKMWNKSKYPKLRSDSEHDEHSSCFEDDAIYKFINVPSEMKLLIVVDRLLTGFDAPSATYLYIDKKMQDHGLFQAICRVNRLDKDKDLGYIVDYKDLFESIEGAVEDYTSGAFDNFEKEDITGLLKNRLDFCKSRLDNALKQVKVICEPIDAPKGTLEFLHHFVGQELSIDESREEQLKETESKRIEFYNAVSNLVIAYTNIADEMTKAGYTKEYSKSIKEQVNFYNAARDEVMKAAGDYIELKNYDGAMRYMIDNYINADASELQYKLDEATLLDVIVASGIEKATQTLPKNVRKNAKSVALAIEANIASTIINNTPINPRYYNKMSELLKELIDMKKDQNLDYQDYIKHLVELVMKVKNPETSGEYPTSIHNVRLRGLYDVLDKDEKETLILYDALTSSVPKDFMDSKMKQREVKFLIKTIVNDESKVDEIFNLWKNTRGY